MMKKLLKDYSSFFEAELTGRYITLNHISPLLERYKNVFKISKIGSSQLGKDIPMITVGHGKKNVLGWSQMHGNESTTTKAVFDFLKLVADKKLLRDEISTFLETYTFHIIPILNPDGAEKYTRENAKAVDLNRDAQELSQPESKVLRKIFDNIAPDLCLNLHDQRTIYGFKDGKTATVSFLSPAANKKRTITPARRKAMDLIEKMATTLQTLIPGHIGRYDDTFNPNCVGDSFQMRGVPTILFEAGHYPNDYVREHTRAYICVALLALFDIIKETGGTSIAYRGIPENKKNFKDLIIRNVSVPEMSKPTSVAFQYQEIVTDGAIKFVLCVDEIAALKNYYGHKEVDVDGAEILVNSQEKYRVGDKVSEIFNKKDNLVLFINKD
ncbi:M14 family zinc carboxypeptidase [Marinirhabdus gelatinilytica]|uniref:Zinc carboxypeptidase n=1 Tax=Marinirhabdus gelatinilytica TaxID=1703343 RepID=A0A370QAG2_9FLAO|nr:M14 family zinc carboxypeptidase [Marinirhabdus gelatinilytica]RDK85364.1 zinc carboxypeptidase [Marinirhabdus gelatinilytica]